MNVKERIFFFLTDCRSVVNNFKRKMFISPTISLTFCSNIKSDPLLSKQPSYELYMQSVLFIGDEYTKSERFSGWNHQQRFYCSPNICEPSAVVSILVYGCTTWALTKRMEKKLGGNYTRMLRAILNKSRKQHPTKQLLYGHLPPITKTI